MMCDWIVSTIYGPAVDYWHANATFWGPIMTTLGVVIALIVPWLRQRKERRRQDSTTVRGLAMYLTALRTKLRQAIITLEEVEARDRALRKAIDDANINGRNPSQDEKVIQAEVELRNATNHSALYCDKFEEKNRVNYRGIEQQYVNTELSDTRVRQALLNLVSYLKVAPNVRTKSDFETHLAMIEMMITQCERKRSRCWKITRR